MLKAIDEKTISSKPISLEFKPFKINSIVLFLSKPLGVNEVMLINRTPRPVLTNVGSPSSQSRKPPESSS